MTTAFEQHRATFREYLLVEEQSGVKHEHIEGVIVAMSGATLPHNWLVQLVAFQLMEQLRGGSCRVLSSDQRVRVMATGLATYPDVLVVCGEPEYDPEDGKKTTLLNPRLIVEVLSPSTEKYDRGEKLEHYKQIDSLELVLLVDPKGRGVEVEARREAGVFTYWQHAGGRHELIAGLWLDVDRLFREAEGV